MHPLYAKNQQNVPEGVHFVGFWLIFLQFIGVEGAHFVIFGGAFSTPGEGMPPMPPPLRSASDGHQLII
jgi:hypothetical protein